MADKSVAREEYEAKLADAQAAWEEAKAKAGGGEVSTVRPLAPFDLDTIKDEEIQAAFEVENYGDAELTRRLLRARWLRDALTVKDGEGGDFYKWDGRYWAPDTYSTLMDELRPLNELYLRMAAPAQAKIADLKKKCDAAKAQLKTLRMKKANRDEAAIIDQETELNELRTALEEQKATLKPIERRAKAVCLRPRLKNILNMAFSCEGLQTDGLSWNQIEYYLPMQNGTMDLRNGKMVEPRPEHLFNRIIPWSFEGFDAPCDFFKKMVRQFMCNNDEMYEYFLDSLATCLIGKQEKVLYLWLGPKANNGKSTMDDLMKRLLGVDGGFCVDFNIANYLYTGPKDAERPAAGLLQLFGARCAISGEPGNQDFLDLGKAKKLSSGGDSINARTLNSPKMKSFKQTQTGIIHCNAIPRCSGSDAGLQSRLRAIMFKAQFLREEELPGGQPDEANHIYKAIDKTVIKERLDGEMPGILAELVKRAMKIYAGDRAPVPPEVMEAGKDYIAENDLALQYLTERTRPAPGAKIQAAALYDDFRGVCVYLFGLARGKVPTRTKFGLMMKPHLLKEKAIEDGGRWYYLDIEFIPGQPTIKELKNQDDDDGGQERGLYS